MSLDASSRVIGARQHELARAILNAAALLAARQSTYDRDPQLRAKIAADFVFTVAFAAELNAGDGGRPDGSSTRWAPVTLWLRRVA